MALCVRAILQMSLSKRRCAAPMWMEHFQLRTPTHRVYALHENTQIRQYPGMGLRTGIRLRNTPEMARLRCSDKEVTPGVEYCQIQESVRRLHNSENNPHKYVPQTRINSSHNLAVTTYLFEELRSTFTDVDPECVKAGWKMYFETLRRKYSLAQPEKAQKRKTMTSIAKNLQRKRLLLETRSGVVKTNTEKELWKTATIELMSDEDDAIVDGRPTRSERTDGLLDCLPDLEGKRGREVSSQPVS
ncbi:hypothetical protein F2P79_018242 [Pimephales promelas]|nr:hypothetical protein F2P79_018242 [Pimephales promelas]